MTTFAKAASEPKPVKGAGEATTVDVSNCLRTPACLNRAATPAPLPSASAAANHKGSEALCELAFRHDLAEAMSLFYEEVDAVVASHRPTCWNRGACCKFGEYGHRLYVTDLELAYFIRGQRDKWRRPTAEASCPYQFNGLCNVRQHRPLGCRIFFCDESAQGWQGPELEKLHARLKVLGERLGVPYCYREWLSALDDVDLPDDGGLSPILKKGVTIGGDPKPRGETDGRSIIAPEVDPRRLPVIQ
jgi:Fe-S-cluster containining protein